MHNSKDFYCQRALLLITFKEYYYWSPDCSIGAYKFAFNGLTDFFLENINSLYCGKTIQSSIITTALLLVHALQIKMNWVIIIIVKLTVTYLCIETAYVAMYVAT